MFRHSFVNASLLAALLCLVLLLNGAAAMGQDARQGQAAPYQQWRESVQADLTRFHMPEWLLESAGRPDSAVARQSPALVAGHHRLVYQSYDRQEWNIYYDDLSGAPPLLLAHTPQSELQPRLNRGVTRIVFASDRDGDFELFAIDPDGANLMQLTDNDHDDVNPSWSPDGQQIAFESYRHGQPEIYVMDADGANQQRLTFRPDFDGFPAWSPDGAHIAFTSFADNSYNIYRMHANGAGLTQLTAGMSSLYPAWSPDGRTIAFSADGDDDSWLELWTMDADGSNAQQRRNGVPETDFWVNGWFGNAPQQSVLGTAVSYNFSGGQWFWNDTELFEWVLDGSYTTFGDDSGVAWHPDIASIDGTAPVMPAVSLAEFSRQEVNASWLDAPDTGGSGTYGYDADVQEVPGGPWQVLYRQRTETGFQETFPAGKMYRFRVRALDEAHNYSAWLYTMPTTVYTWKVESHVLDNRGNPLPHAAVHTEPPSFVAFERNAVYANYVGDERTPYEVTWSLPGYGDLPPGFFSLSDGDAMIAVVLPPANDVIDDGDFESGTLQGWHFSDPQSTTLQDGVAKTGRYSVYLDANAAAATSISQTVTIPGDMPNPTLSFFYTLAADFGITPQLEVLVSDGQATQSVLSLSGEREAWDHAWVDLSTWQGEKVTLTFSRPAGVRVASLDDITLGSTSPDLWLATSGALSAMPGETVTRTLYFGNRGGVAAPDAQLTLTLPGALTLVEAVPTASGANPYTWNLGTVTAGGSDSITLVLTMAGSVTPGQIVTAQALVETPYEAYLLNNELDLDFLVGRQILMPLIMRP